MLMLAAGQAQTPGDQWLTSAGTFPDGASGSSTQSNRFQTLRAEGIAGKLRVSWETDDSNAATQQVTLRSSAGTPGHWPARDWRSHFMTRRDSRWDARVPVEDPDEPIIYFVEVIGGGQTNRSPLRIVTPRAVGLDEPTRTFWPFLEGFEEGLESWHVLTSGEPAATLRLAPEARTGRTALAVNMQKPNRSVTIATTRLRGWQLLQRNATGVRLWVRTRDGSAPLRFALFSDAFTRDQRSNFWPGSIPVSSRWQKVDLYFSDLGSAWLGSVDIFAIEFTADAPAELQVDDLQLIGPWRMEP